MDHIFFSLRDNSAGKKFGNEVLLKLNAKKYSRTYLPNVAQLWFANVYIIYGMTNGLELCLQYVYVYTLIYYVDPVLWVHCLARTRRTAVMSKVHNNHVIAVQQIEDLW